MENLNLLTEKDLLNLVFGIVAGYEYNEPIDEDYQLAFEVSDRNDHFKVGYTWTKGIIPGKGQDPQTSTDNKPVSDHNYFKIFKSESLEKLTREVMDAITEVTAHSFDPEMSH